MSFLKAVLISFLVLVALGFVYFVVSIANTIKVNKNAPSPFNQVDESKLCSYQDCYDKCFLESELTSKNRCPVLLCGCQESNFYCAYENNLCVKKEKPKCISLDFRIGTGTRYYYCKGSGFYTKKYL